MRVCFFWPLTIGFWRVFNNTGIVHDHNTRPILKTNEGTSLAQDILDAQQIGTSRFFIVSLISNKIWNVSVDLLFLKYKSVNVVRKRIIMRKIKTRSIYSIVNKIIEVENQTTHDINIILETLHFFSFSLARWRSFEIQK